MKTLYLLRHAKSAWDDPDLSDHDRPLAERGDEDAEAMGKAWRHNGVRVDRVITSSACRARRTLELVLETAGIDPPVEVDQGLYLCGRRAWVERLRQLPEGAETVLVVGHNPDIHELALYLTGSGDKDLRKSLGRKFPTCACATLRLPIAAWLHLDRGGAELVAFEAPGKVRSA